MNHDRHAPMAAMFSEMLEVSSFGGFVLKMPAVYQFLKDSMSSRVDCSVSR